MKFVLMEKIKRLLILEAAEDICTAELVNIKAVAALHKIQSDHCKITSLKDLEKCVQNSAPYDYIYLCAHANRESFGTSDGTVSISWADFGQLVCEDNFINENAIFLLACCRSGINQVAYDLFYSCEKIDFVCGPKWHVSPQALTLAFNVFLFQVELKGSDPTEAAERMTAATGNTFVFFDRVNTEHEPSYLRHIDLIASRPDEADEQSIQIPEQLN